MVSKVVDCAKRACFIGATTSSITATSWATREERLSVTDPSMLFSTGMMPLSKVPSEISFTIAVIEFRNAISSEKDRETLWEYVPAGPNVSMLIFHRLLH